MYQKLIRGITVVLQLSVERVKWHCTEANMPEYI